MLKVLAHKHLKHLRPFEASLQALQARLPRTGGQNQGQFFFRQHGISTCLGMQQRHLALVLYLMQPEMASSY